MNKASSSTLVTHYTTATAATPIRRVKPLCGKSSRTTAYMIVTDGRPVDCKDCLVKAEN